LEKAEFEEASLGEGEFGAEGWRVLRRFGKEDRKERKEKGIRIKKEGRWREKRKKQIGRGKKGRLERRRVTEGKSRKEGRKEGEGNTVKRSGKERRKKKKRGRKG